MSHKAGQRFEFPMALFRKLRLTPLGRIIAAVASVHLICIIGGGAIVAAVSASTSAVGTSASKNPAAGNQEDEPFCGIYCLYAALRLAHSDAPLRSLLKPDNLSSNNGSSIETLERIASENGLSTLSVVGLSSGDLVSLSAPALLHVRARSNPKEYNHFVLFLGTAGSDAIVFDPEALSDGGRCSFRDLVKRWDGAALLVSPKPIDAGPLVDRGRERLWLFAAIAGCAALAARQLDKAGSHRSRSARGLFASRWSTSGVVVIAVGTGVGIMTNTFSHGGLLSGSVQGSLIDGAYAGQFLPSVTTQRVAAMLKSGSVTIVDARMVRDFDHGHIPGSVNIPPESPPGMRRGLLASMPRGGPIIIYCQSLTCPFSEQLAGDLLSDGFTNLSLYRGGWEEWSASH
jgi:rhodanese-related sulfurtransferase